MTSVIKCHWVFVMTSWHCLGCFDYDKVTLIKVTLPEVVFVMTTGHTYTPARCKSSIELNFSLREQNAMQINEQETDYCGLWVH